MASRIPDFTGPLCGRHGEQSADSDGKDHQSPAAGNPNNHAGSAQYLMLSNNPRECVAALSTRRPAADNVADDERKDVSAESLARTW